MFPPSLFKRYARELSRRACYWPLRSLYCSSPRFRSYYWENRAPDVHAQWGFATADFDNLTSVIRECAPRSILDFGCGSGRVLPLYSKLAIPEVVGYDVSVEALKICRERLPSGNIALFSGELSAMPFPAEHFDLVICNRVLQHIPPNRIQSTLSALAYYSKAFYLWEMSKEDWTSRFFFMFLHEYERLLAPLGFKIVRSGGRGVNHWILLSRSSAIDNCLPSV